MQLVIAEKPSVARNIAKVLHATNAKDGYLEGKEYLLNPGDCVHIPANAPHSWKNPTAHTAKLFGAYCV